MLPTKIKRVLLEPDPRLRLPNEDVRETWDELEPWVKLMWKAMGRAWTKGVGLAAPQVGWNVRLFIMDPGDDPDGAPKPFRMDSNVFWNPTICEVSGTAVPKKEGCLSLPNVWGQVLRYPVVRLKATSPDGPVDVVYSDLAAQIVQHEMDHLKGELCLDKLTKKATA
jgi:peptide deformylase